MYLRAKAPPTYHAAVVLVLELIKLSTPHVDLASKHLGGGETDFSVHLSVHSSQVIGLPERTEPAYFMQLMRAVDTAATARVAQAGTWEEACQNAKCGPVSAT
jgi:hypothetical protein